MKVTSSRVTVVFASLVTESVMDVMTASMERMNKTAPVQNTSLSVAAVDASQTIWSVTEI